MATKSFEAKIVCKPDEKYTAEQKKQFLWFTHQVFNDGVRKVIPYVFKMKRGELGPEFQAIYYAITSSQDAIGKLEAVINPDWTSGKIGKSDPNKWKELLKYQELEKGFRQRLKEEGIKSTKKFRKELEDEKKKLAKEIGQKDIWADAAAILRNKNLLLFNRDELLPNLPSEFRRKIYEMTIQLIHGHQELVANWEDEHAEWLIEKDKWEEEHPEYMHVRPIFEKFEKEQGKVKGSRIRWLAYLDFLSSKPELANWRGKAKETIPLTKEERAGFRKPGQHFAAFFNKNPELQELDRLHKEYQEKFARTQSKRTPHPDGFKHRPTFTLPDAMRHPVWYSFKGATDPTKGSTYRNLDLENCTLDLKVLTAMEGEGRNPGGMIQYAFEPDERIKGFRYVGTTEKGKRAKGYIYYDPILEKERPAKIQGIKLVFRPPRPDGTAYLIFSCQIEDEKPKIKIWKDKEEESPGEITKRKKTEVYPPELITLAIDFGQRHLGAITICKNNNGRPEPIRFIPAYPKRRKDRESKPVSAWLAKIPGLTFNAVGMHEKEISAGMSRRFQDPKSIRQAGEKEGRKSKGQHIPETETPWAHLREHIANMKEDHYKKAANLIIRTALQNGAQVILIENLRNYRPMLERTNLENRRRMQWAVRQTAKFLEDTARPLGLIVRQVSSAYTSRFCSSCGHPGARVSLPGQKNWEKFYAEKYGKERKMIAVAGGQFFCCPACKKIINADINASLNMHKVFYQNFIWPGKIDKKDTKNFIWQGKNYNWDQIADDVQSFLDQKAGIKKEDDIPY